MSGVAKWMNVITSADSKDVKDVEMSWSSNREVEEVLRRGKEQYYVVN